MELKPTRKSVVKDPGDQFGVYMWRMPNGAYVADEGRNFLLVRAEHGSIIQQAKLRAAARAHGIMEGDPVFFPGHYPVSDEEYEEQKGRMSDGLIPDKNDIGALVDEAKARKAGLDG